MAEWKEAPVQGMDLEYIRKPTHPSPGSQMVVLSQLGPPRQHDSPGSPWQPVAAPMPRRSDNHLNGQIRKLKNTVTH